MHRQVTSETQAFLRAFLIQSRRFINASHVHRYYRVMHRVMDAFLLRVARFRNTFDYFDGWMNFVDKDVRLRFGDAIRSHALNGLLLDWNAGRERHVNDLNF